MPRLDQLLVDRGLYATRARARDAVLRGKVTVDGRSASKPGAAVRADAAIETADEARGYVSRAALKLAHALDTFGISPTGLDALDLGASTGGFTPVIPACACSKASTCATSPQPICPDRPTSSPPT